MKDGVRLKTSLMRHRSEASGTDGPAAEAVVTSLRGDGVGELLRQSPSLCACREPALYRFPFITPAAVATLQLYRRDLTDAQAEISP